MTVGTTFWKPLLEPPFSSVQQEPTILRPKCLRVWLDDCVMTLCVWLCDPMTACDWNPAPPSRCNGLPRRVHDQRWFQPTGGNGGLFPPIGGALSWERGGEIALGRGFASSGQSAKLQPTDSDSENLRLPSEAWKDLLIRPNCLLRHPSRPPQILQSRPTTIKYPISRIWGFQKCQHLHKDSQVLFDWIIVFWSVLIAPSRPALISPIKDITG